MGGGQSRKIKNTKLGGRGATRRELESGVRWFWAIGGPNPKEGEIHTVKKGDQQKPGQPILQDPGGAGEEGEYSMESRNEEKDKRKGLSAWKGT